MSAIPHAIPTPISFDAARFVAVEEAASLLEIDAGNLRRKCRDELAQHGLAVRIAPPEGGQEKWLIHRDYNPRLIGGDFATLYRESDLSSLSMKQQQGARNRRLCVEELRRDRRDRPGAMTTWLPALIGALQERFPELVVSRTRLYCWDGLYQRPCDLVKLVDLRGGDRRSQGGPEGWKAFKDLYLHPNQPSVKQCWREVHRIARQNGWIWCSLKSCHAQMDKRIDPETQVQHRQPAVYRHQMEPTIEQNPEAWKAGECWVGDHKQLDMWCMYAEKLVRPWLTTWMDWRTRRVAGYVLSDNPNSSTILAALRHGLMDERNMGGPGVVWIDNGRDYDSWTFHGQTKKQRLGRLDVKLDENSAVGVFRSLQIEPHFAVPYNPNGKSRMERWFRTLETFCKTYDTYAGDGVDTRPERLNEILSRPGLIPPFKDVLERMTAHIEGNNQRTDHDIADLMEANQRLSPDEAMARWCTTRRVWADPAALDLCLQQWNKPTTVGRNGIALTIQGQAFRYGQFEPALRVFKGLHKQDRRPVHVSYDPHDIRTIRVYDDQYRFITVAKMNDQGGLHDGDPISQEKVSDLNRQKAHYNKAKKHVAEFSLTSVLTNEEQLAATVSKAAALVPAPYSMRIIRTPLDGQAKAIAKQEFRKAVGAEATDPSEHAGLNILEQLRQQRQTVRPRSDEFSSDPWSTLRSRENG